VKYWGKHPGQIPANPSISFTLDACYTETEVRVSDKRSSAQFDFDIWLDGIQKDSFKAKIETFFKAIVHEAPFLTEQRFEIHTHNSFPHSSGIASSASGLSALALCLLSLSGAEEHMSKEAFLQKASHWARIGSGSASRSVYGGLVNWGTFAGLEGSSNEHGLSVSENIHEDFLSYRDFVLLVEVGSKSVSSTVGHGLMNGHPFAEQRFEQAHRHLAHLLKLMQGPNFDEVGKLIEQEALTLHAMMMTSDPYFILMKPNTVTIIDLIWQFRAATNIPAYFTLDAGANVHLLCPEAHEQAVQNFVEQELSMYLNQSKYICDRVGQGPVKLT
jgi:diphosphomevalonate decarboxylase